MNESLTRVRVAGFRSLRDVTVEFGPRTLLIGPNGSGKSNLLSVLQMVPLMRTQSLARFVGERGGASAILHYGASKTREIEIEITFNSGSNDSTYAARLGYAAGDTLLYLDESVSFGGEGSASPQPTTLGAGHSESILSDRAKDPRTPVVRDLNGLLSRMSFFHFHDTSPTSPLRQNAHQSDDRYLRSDGSNLAAFLYRLCRGDDDGARSSWKLIQGTVRRIAPFIKELAPALVNPGHPQSSTRLFWVDERDHRFDVHDLSDGTLRAIALITALGQPSTSVPRFIAIDEPELGLHPAALSLVASLVRSVSSRCQVLLSTQSSALIDEFDPSEVVVVEQRDGESKLRRLDAEELAGWLDEYTLSELYEKNVFGGRP
ncbi:MAG: AAA family ATPase [Candidatus Eisenbacteria bacterium]|nr:AAA family ATPase [Candidatus Eisenbacteria bacterium]MCC7142840.1 AAA family ATPase [Candidatus Eisenbacteria bacterium]